MTQQEIDAQVEKNTKHFQRYEVLVQDRKNVEAKWQKIDRLIVPFDQGVFATRIEREAQKDWSSLDVWDSTAPIGQEKLCELFYAGFISGRWLGIEFHSTKLKKSPKAGEWLEDTVDRVFETIMSSNFPIAFGELVSHWVNYGNGVMASTVKYDRKKNFDGFDFNDRPPRAMFFEEDFEGRVHRSYTPLEWSATQIVSKFRDPKDVTKPHESVPQEIVEFSKGPNGAGQKFKLLFVTEPREGVEPMGYGEKVRSPELRPFATFYILEKTKRTLGEEGGEYEMPVDVTRYMRSSNSMWGYGPSMLVLPTVGLLNGIQEQVVDAGAKVLNPATLVTEWGLMSDLKLGPGEYTTVRSLDDIKAYESSARFDVSDDILNRHAAMVRQYYREDEISFRNSPQMSATEATLRDNRLNALFGRPTRRMFWEMLGPKVRSTFNHMMREGQLDAPPDEVLQDKNPKLKINFFGRFARAIREDETVAIERLLTAKAAMVKMDERSRARFVIKDDKAIREMAERLATPPGMLASEQEVEDAVANEQKMQQAAQEAAIAKTQGEGARAMAGAQETMQGVNGGGMPPGGGM